MIYRLIAREGGYVDNPADPGGCTNFGITRAAYHDLIGRPITCDELKKLTTKQAHEFYLKWGSRYGIWDLMPLGLPLVEVMLDTSVLFGPGRAIRWLQLEAGVEDDGFVGPKTIEGAGKVGSSKVALGVINRRINHHFGRAANNYQQFQFLKGWIRRSFDLVTRLV